MTGSLANFFAAARPLPTSGNTTWASMYAQDIRRVWQQAAHHHPRSQQVHLGPSEIGAPCDRQVAGKFAQVAPTNHVIDPWPSTRGVALHAYAEDRVFPLDNEVQGWERWLPERRVVPHPDHSGTADLYDWQYCAVVDHKFLGRSSMDKVRGKDGPPVTYQRQLKLYGRGYRNAGFPVQRVVLVAYPATAASLDDLYVWEHELTEFDDVELDWLLNELTPYRRAWANQIIAGNATLMDVPASSDNESCFFCPFYRPQTAKDGGPGCPGHAAK